MDDYIKKDLQYIIDGCLSTYETAIETHEMYINGVDKLYVLEDTIRLTATPSSFAYNDEEVTEIVNMWKEAFKNHPQMLQIFDKIKK